MRLNNTRGAWTLKMRTVDIWIWVYDLKQRQWKKKAQRSCDFCTYDMENNTTGVLTWVFFRMITLLYSKVCIHSWSILLLCEVRTVNSGSQALCRGRGWGGAGWAVFVIPVYLPPSRVSCPRSFWRLLQEPCTVFIFSLLGLDTVWRCVSKPLEPQLGPHRQRAANRPHYCKANICL